MAVRESDGERGRRDRSGRSKSQLADIAVPLALLGLLGVQFLLGMAINLFVHISPAGAGMAEMMGNGPLVGIHMMLGMILAVGGALGVATALHNGWPATVCAVVALGGILVAGLGGVAFLMGGQSNSASYLMAVGFLVAVGGYVAEVLAVR
ncbi:MAG: hypothetical protein M0Z29_05105 [Actinomycetota bacterium]|nr:hypothetical protein [Actinomycetota bacterium]